MRKLKVIFKLTFKPWAWGLLVLVILPPLIYSYFRVAEVSYWDDVMGNLIATLVGVIIGIPFALEINRLIVRQEEKKKLNEARQKNKDILMLIKQELIFNLDRLKDRQSIPNALQTHPYQVDVWEAFSDSGEIRWISNANLLNRIASAYSAIKIEKSIEQNAYLAAKGAFAFSGTDRALKSILEDARRFDKILKANTEHAVKEIDEELKVL